MALYKSIYFTSLLLLYEYELNKWECTSVELTGFSLYTWLSVAVASESLKIRPPSSSVVFYSLQRVISILSIWQSAQILISLVINAQNISRKRKRKKIFATSTFMIYRDNGMFHLDRMYKGFSSYHYFVLISSAHNEALRRQTWLIGRLTHWVGRWLFVNAISQDLQKHDFKLCMQIIIYVMARRCPFIFFS